MLFLATRPQFETFETMVRQRLACNFTVLSTKVRNQFLDSMLAWDVYFRGSILWANMT